MTTKFRITAGQLLPRVQEAARNSSNVVYVPPPNKRSIAGMMQFLQASRCLQEGQMVGRPRLNEHGDWEFQMKRFAANNWTYFNVVASVEGARVTRLYVLMED